MSIHQDFNNLLSRLDTLHDFCDPGANRNKDASLDKNDKTKRIKEYNNVFKPEILRSLEKERKIESISKHKLIPPFCGNMGYVDRYVEHKSLKEFYKQDLKNLIDRTQNGLIFVNNMKNIDKETFLKTSGRVKRFEPSVVAFYEFLYNATNDGTGIGKFISNKYLPIFDYVNGRYSICNNDGNYVDAQTELPGNSYIPPTSKSIIGFIDKCKTRKEKVVSFILGQCDEHDKGQYLLQTNDTTGFYRLQKPPGSANMNGNIFINRLDNSDDPNLRYNYKRYLKDLRAILGRYFEVPDQTIIYLVVDTSNISFSRYYEFLQGETNDIKLQVVCNVAMEWDGANSPSCQEGVSQVVKRIKHGQKIMQENIEVNNPDQAIYDINSIELVKDYKGTSVRMEGSNTLQGKINDYPREVGQLSECIRQQINPKRPKTTMCKVFKTKGALLDIKRSGDAIQALMAKELQKARSVSTDPFAVFVTLDHLAFLKARIAGVPSLYTSFMLGKDEDEGATKVITLFNPSFEVNIDSLLKEFVEEKSKFGTIGDMISNEFDLMGNESVTNSAYKHVYFMIDYLCRAMFGIAVCNRPIDNNGSVTEQVFHEDDLVKDSDLQHVDRDILSYVTQLVLETFSSVQPKKQKWMFKYIKEYKTSCILSHFKNTLNNIAIHTNNINNELVSRVQHLASIARAQNKAEVVISGEYVNVDKLNEITQRFVLFAFVIECFYTIKRLLIFKHYFDDMRDLELNKIQTNIDDITRLSLQADDNKKREWGAQVSAYNDRLKDLNKKYEFFYGERLGALRKCMQNVYNHIESQNVLKALFGLSIDEYQITIDKFKTELTKAETELLTRVKLFADKFDKPDYFVEPTRPSRHSLRVIDKIQEFNEYFSDANRFHTIIHDVLYKRYYDSCEQFYKAKIADLHLSNISAKPIEFEGAVNALTRLDIMNNLPRNVMQGGTSSSRTTKIIKHSQDKHPTVDKIGGGVSAIDIDNMFALLDCDFLFETSLTSSNNSPDMSFDESDHVYRSILLRYKNFLRPIMLSDVSYYPMWYRVKGDDWQGELNEWRRVMFYNQNPHHIGEIQQSDLEGLFKPDNMYTHIEMGIEKVDFAYLNMTKLIDTVIHHITQGKDIEYMNLYPQYLRISKDNISLFVQLTKCILKECVTIFNIMLVDFYSAYSKTYKLPDKKDDNLVFDMILWMMVNDKSHLLTHPYRDFTKSPNVNWKYIQTQPFWHDVENAIINHIGQASEMLYRPHSLTGGGADTILGKRNNGRYDENSDDEDMGSYYDSEDESEYIRHKVPEQRFVKQRIEDDSYPEYVTMDEYLDIISCFTSPFYGLRANLGIITTLDIDNGTFNQDRIFTPNDLLPSQYDNMDIFGGSSIKMTMAEYHKRYYKPYFKLYHS